MCRGVVRKLCMLFMAVYVYVCKEKYRTAAFLTVLKITDIVRRAFTTTKVYVAPTIIEYIKDKILNTLNQ